MIKRWQENLGLQEWTITTKEIMREQVVYDEDCSEEERFFIGVTTNVKEKSAVIYYDVPLYEEAIVHELLHIKYPSKSEDWIEEETNRQLNNVKQINK